MLLVSEKEFEILKRELADVKACITRYIGYIISVAGLASIITKYLLHQSTMQIFACILIFIACLIITFLFEVIWYKFKSHNRYVGYIRLISQELGYHSLKGNAEKGTLKNKNYLDEDYKIDFENSNLSLFGWDLIVSRYGDAKFSDEHSTVTKVTDKSKFVFSLPQGFKHSDVKEFLQLDQKYFKNIIFPLNRRNYKQNKFSRKNLYKVLKYLYFENNKSKIRLNESKVDDIYISNGWLYPRTITQIGFLSIIMLVGGGFAISCYEICQIFLGKLSEDSLLFYNGNDYRLLYSLTIVSLLLIFNSLLLYQWFKRFILQLPQLINGYYSINYYCWAYFPFRVQFLNSSDIIPVYFSRGFIRYFKSLLSHDLVDSLATNRFTDFKSCDSCKKGSENTVKTEYKSVNNDDLAKEKVLFCCDCMEKYKTELLGAEKFCDSSSYIHEIIKPLLNEWISEKRKMDHHRT